MRVRFCLILCALACAARLDAAESALTIDAAQSRIEIAVKATVDSFVGQLKAFAPQIMVAENGRVASARLAFQFKDIVTGKDRRDAAMHEWQHTKDFPDGLFVLTTLEGEGAGATAALGRLTLHGITREVRFPVAIARDGPRYAIDGDAAVDTREFGLPKIRMLGVLTVDPVVHVRFHLQGDRTGVPAHEP